MAAKIKRHIQHWEQYSPSRTDALLTLELVLSLLSEALPMALTEVGKASPEVQENFWRAYIDFDREADLDLHIKTDECTDKSEALARLLVDWAEVVRNRVEARTGSLTDEPA